jgi:hypothetical protein
MRLPWVPILLRTRTIHHVVPYSFIVQEIKTHQVEQAKILPENNIFVRMVHKMQLELIQKSKKL